MRKLIKITMFTLVFVSLVCALTICVNAKNYVVDYENVLSASQESFLEDKLSNLSEKYQCDMVFLTTNSFNGKTAQRYAENYYDNNGYGYDSDGTGVIYVLSAEQREYYICTTGKANKIFKGNRMDYLESSILTCLQNDDFDGSAYAYANKATEILESYEAGIDTETLKTGIVISVIAGAIIGLIVVLVLRAKMNNAKPQKTAGHYIRDGSFNLTVCRDMYLYSTVRRVARPKNNGSNSGGRSGGRSHGGRGGRF